MNKEGIIKLYNEGENHLEISNKYYAAHRVLDNTFTYRAAEQDVIDTILEHNKRKEPIK